jgi:hypothetical protein
MSKKLFDFFHFPRFSLLFFANQRLIRFSVLPEIVFALGCNLAKYNNKAAQAPSLEKIGNSICACERLKRK